MSALHDPSVWLNAPGRLWMPRPYRGLNMHNS